MHKHSVILSGNIVIIVKKNPFSAICAYTHNDCMCVMLHCTIADAYTFVIEAHFCVILISRLDHDDQSISMDRVLQ